MLITYFVFFLPFGQKIVFSHQISDMKIRFFKLQKNKQFYYKPRYYQDVEESENGKFSIRKKNSRQSIGEQWREARQSSRNHKNRGFSSTFVIILIVLILLVLYLFCFDLSIFFAK